MCLSPGIPNAPLPPPPPAPPQATATKAEQPDASRQAELLAARLGSSSLAIPYTPIQIPR